MNRKKKYNLKVEDKKNIPECTATVNTVKPLIIKENVIEYLHKTEYIIITNSDYFPSEYFNQ